MTGERHAMLTGAFRYWLKKQGWEEVTDWGFTEGLHAMGRGERLVAAVRAEPGGIDSAYGQLLAQIYEEPYTSPFTNEPESVEYAVVVPADETSIGTAQMVKPRVRKMLNISIYCVSDDGEVARVPD